MKCIHIWVFILLISTDNVLSKSLSKKIEKRYINSCQSGCQEQCNGNNCNNCNDNNICCTTQSCNTCVNICSSQCSTKACNNNCVEACSNNSNCKNSSCSKEACSNCVDSCSNNCLSQRCNESCSRNCNRECEDRPTPVEPIINRPDDRPIEVVELESPNITINNTHNNVVNLTTHVNIHNIINNYNNISTPVFVNTTNINNIGLIGGRSSGEGKETIIIRNETIYITQPPPVIIQPPVTEPPVPPVVTHPPTVVTYPPPDYSTPRPNTVNCCYVMHPVQCYVESSGRKRCIIRRHWECSEICTSPVIVIEEVNENTEIIPQTQRPQFGCQYVQNYPYVYCGNYQNRECGQCYNCNGAYNPQSCSQTVECSDPCKMTIPNCIPNNSGVYCL